MLLLKVLTLSIIHRTVRVYFLIFPGKDDIERHDVQGSYIPIEAHLSPKGVCQEILPLGFTSLLSAVYKYTQPGLLSTEREKEPKMVFITLLYLLAS